jgi:hypothetical protein
MIGSADLGFPSWYEMPNAVFSPDRRFRYILRRDLRDLGRAVPLRPVVFLMLNPSTADETKLDPTLRRCRAFSIAWGGSEMVIVNLFALRSPYPKDLWADGVADPIGPQNDDAIRYAVDYGLGNGGRVIAGWGNHGRYMDRQETILGWYPRELECLAWNEKGGTPKHPLYISGDAEPRPVAEYVRAG